VKVSFRSNGEADVNRLARQFDGGGHVRASGAVIQGGVDEVVQDVVQAAAGVLPGGSGTSERGEPEGREART